MQIIEADLPKIRRLEAISFRSFPATTTFFNGTWAVRLSAGLPAKRLNSINPLDPHDNWNIEHRVRQEVRRFDIFGRATTFRITPLAPDSLIFFLKETGWQEFDESIVMVLDLDRINLENAHNRLPFKDIGFWVDKVSHMEDEPIGSKPGKVEAIEAAEGQSGLFLLLQDNADPVCALRAVLDSEFVGLFNIVTDKSHTRKGHATSLLFSTLLWARQQGAKFAWLQVECANLSAISLYESLGFQPVYQYVYYRQPHS